ncbi:MAG: hypothetical protein N4A74_11600 [Carboxylicivirga sp.]|jgi:hypothetical protein|nr:hypothetical protein [Carboxylicivirga sp.]
MIRLNRQPLTVVLQPLITNILTLTIFPILFGFSFNLFYVIPCFILFFLTGEWFYSYFFKKIKLDYTLKYGINIFIGGLITFPFICLLSAINMWLAKIIFTFILLLFIRHYKFKLTINDHNVNYYILILFVFITTLYGRNIYEAFADHPLLQGELTDNYFYTSIVSSLREGTIFSSKYESGSPIVYHLGGFIWPASLSALSGINSHTTLWQIFIPFMRFLCTYFIGYIIALIASHIFKTKLTYKNILISVLTFIGISSINPKYFLLLDLKKIIWIGTPFTLADKPALVSSLVIVFFLSFLLITIQKWDKKKMIGTIIIFSALVCFKVTTFFVFASLFTLLAILIYWKEKQTIYIRIILLSALPTLGIYYLFYINEFANIKSVIEPFYLSEYFLTLAKQNFNSHLDVIKGLLIFGITFLVWIGFKFVGLTNILLKKERLKIAIPLLMTFIVLLVMGSVLRIKVIDEKGIILHDISYDIMQFFKFYLLVITIIASAGMLELITNAKSKNRYLSIVLYPSVSLYFIVVYVSLISFNFPIKSLNEDNWAKSVSQELKMANPQLCIMQPSNEFPGQLVSAYDVSPFLVAINNRVGGVTTTYKNDGNRELVNQLFSTEKIDQQTNLITLLHLKGVDCIVANPKTESHLNRMVDNGLLEKESSYNWLYFIPFDQ